MGLKEKQERDGEWLLKQRRLLDKDAVQFVLHLNGREFAELLRSGSFPLPVDIAGAQRWTHADVWNYVRRRELARFLSRLEQGKLTDGYGDPLADNPPSELVGLQGQLREHLGPTACVYFLYLQGALQYVGQTRNLNGRLKSHRKGDKNTPKKEFDRVLYLPVRSEDLDAAESHYIALLDPPLNRAGKP